MSAKSRTPLRLSVAGLTVAIADGIFWARSVRFCAVTTIVSNWPRPVGSFGAAAPCDWFLPPVAPGVAFRPGPELATCASAGPVEISSQLRPRDIRAVAFDMAPSREIFARWRRFFSAAQGAASVRSRAPGVRILR